jgi:hypothetical protein
MRVATVCGVVGFVAMLSAGKTAGRQAALVEELARIDREWGVATTAGDDRALNGILDDQFIAVNLSGIVLNKSQYIEETKQSGRRSVGTTYESSEYNVSSVDANTAIVVHRGTFTVSRGSVSTKESHRSMHVFARRQDRWRVVASTEVAFAK